VYRAGGSLSPEPPRVGGGRVLPRSCGGGLVLFPELETRPGRGFVLNLKPREESGGELVTSVSIFCILKTLADQSNWPFIPRTIRHELSGPHLQCPFRACPPTHCRLQEARVAAIVLQAIDQLIRWAKSERGVAETTRDACGRRGITPINIFDETRAIDWAGRRIPVWGHTTRIESVASRHRKPERRKIGRRWIVARVYTVGTHRVATIALRQDASRSAARVDSARENVEANEGAVGGNARN